MPLMEIGTLTDITNLVKNINNLLTQLSENRLEYCRRIINRYADALIKMAHM